MEQTRLSVLISPLLGPASRGLRIAATQVARPARTVIARLVRACICWVAIPTWPTQRSLTQRKSRTPGPKSSVTFRRIADHRTAAVLDIQQRPPSLLRQSAGIGLLMKWMTCALSAPCEGGRRMLHLFLDQTERLATRWRDAAPVTPVDHQLPGELDGVRVGGVQEQHRRCR